MLTKVLSPPQIRAAAFADCGVLSGFLNNAGFNITDKHKVGEDYHTLLTDLESSMRVNYPKVKFLQFC